jgi:hypothetical protein
MLIASYKAGDSALVGKITKSVKKDLDQQMNYLTSLSDSKQEAMQVEAQDVQRMLMYLQQIEMQFKTPTVIPAETAPKINAQPVVPAKNTDTAKKKK